MKSGRLMKTAFVGAIMLLLTVGLAACGSDPAPTPAASAPVQPTANPQPAATSVPVAAPTAQPTAVPQPTASAVAVATPTAQPTAIPQPTATSVPIATPTSQPTAIPQPTATAVAVATPTPEPTATPEPSSTVPFDVEVVANIDYNGDIIYDSGWDLLDLYLPRGQDDFPVVMLIHGAAGTNGGFYFGDKEEFDRLARYLASQGFGSVSINYRLGRYSYLAFIQDTAHAFAWIHENIQSHGGNPDQLFVLGHSAGAYLAALLASDGKYLAEHGLSITDIRGVAPVSGHYRIDQFDFELIAADTGLSVALVSEDRDQIWGKDVEGWVATSPNTYFSADTPPALFLYAESDRVGREKETEEVAAELRDAGQPNSVAKKVADTDHRSLFFQLGKPGEESTELILNFLKDNL